VQIPSKGDKWYVVITKPKELQAKSKNLQVRRSTGTTDERRAQAAMPGIAADIYKEFDAALRRLEDEPKPPFSIRYATPEEMADTRSWDPFADRRMLPPIQKPKDPATKLSRFVPDYLDHLEKNGVGNVKERRTKRTKCEEFKALVGDL
jgi:hypothetical protein